MPLDLTIGDRAIFIDEDGDEIHEVTIDGVTASESGAGFSFVIHNADGNEWIVEPSELHPPE